MSHRKFNWQFGESWFRKSTPQMPQRTRVARPLAAQIESLEERKLLTVTLGAAGSFAVLGGTEVTNTGPTLISGNLGVSPGGSVTGFAGGQVTNGAIHVNDALAVLAHSDLAKAYNAAAGEAVTTILTGQNLGGLTLAPGVYFFSSSAQLTAKLTLDAKGDPNAQFVFQIGSTLTTASNSSVVLIGGAQPSNVFWQIGSSATLGTGTEFQGNILALTSITVTTGTSILDGSALAINGAVTLDDNAITDDVRGSPTLSGFSGTDTFVKGSAPIEVAPNLVVADSASVDIASATVTITNWQSNEDRLSFYNTFALQHALNVNAANHTATLTLTGVATLADYQKTLRSIMYQDVNDNIPVLTARDASITVNDGVSNSNTAMGNIVVQNATLPPVLSGIETKPLVYAANHPEASTVPISATLMVTDPDSMNLSKATVRITSGYQNSASDHDVLSFVNQNGITGSFNATTGTLTLTGDSYVGNYRAALRSVGFGTSGSAISTATRTLTITVFDEHTPTPLASNSVTRNITITTTNASPTLSGFSGTDTYVKGSAPMTVAPNLVVADSDSAKLASATVTIANWNSHEDRLSFYNSAALENTFNVNTTTKTATFTLTGFATPAQYQTTLRSIKYDDVDDNSPVLTPRAVSITVNDGHSNSNTLAGNIAVKNVDLPPVLSAIETTPLAYTANSTAVAISSSVLVSDPDSTRLSKMTIQITTGYQSDASGHDNLSFVNQNGITGSFNATTGTLTLAGDVAVGFYRGALRSVTFSAKGSAVSTSARTLTIIATDDAATPASSMPITRNVAVQG